MPADVETMFSVREIPWHGMGTILDAPPTSEEAIKAAGLDWEVEARAVFWQSKMNPTRFVEVPNRKMLVRTKDEQPLAVVGHQYQILQNLEAFQFFDPLVDSGIAVYETAGSLQGGRRIWIMARVKNSIKIGGSDEVRPYVLLCNGHDGDTGVLVQPTAVRVVCSNTLMASLGSGMVYKMFHRGDLKAKMEQAAEVIGFTKKRFEEMEAAWLLMQHTEITTERRVDYVRALIPDVPDSSSDLLKARCAGQRDKILELLENGKSVNVPHFDKGTVWAIYNCAVEFADWYMGKTTRDLPNYQLFGRGATFKQRAYTFAMQLARGLPMEVPRNGNQEGLQMNLDEGSGID
jgi:phage/plasmid-like protein (TIGR03299 family)